MAFSPDGKTLISGDFFRPPDLVGLKRYDSENHPHGAGASRICAFDCRQPRRPFRGHRRERQTRSSLDDLRRTDHETRRPPTPGLQRRVSPRRQNADHRRPDGRPQTMASRKLETPEGLQRHRCGSSGGTPSFKLIAAVFEESRSAPTEKRWPSPRSSKSPTPFAGVGTPAVVLFDYKSGKRIRVLKPAKKHTGACWGVVWHSRGFLIGVGGMKRRQAVLLEAGKGSSDVRGQTAECRVTTSPCIRRVINSPSPATTEPFESTICDARSNQRDAEPPVSLDQRYRVVLCNSSRRHPPRRSRRSGGRTSCCWLPMTWVTANSAVKGIGRYPRRISIPSQRTACVSRPVT